MSATCQDGQPLVYYRLRRQPPRQAATVLFCFFQASMSVSLKSRRQLYLRNCSVAAEGFANATTAAPAWPTDYWWARSLLYHFMLMKCSTHLFSGRQAASFLASIISIQYARKPGPHPLCCLSMPTVQSVHSTQYYKDCALAYKVPTGSDLFAPPPALSAKRSSRSGPHCTQGPLFSTRGTAIHDCAAALRCSPVPGYM